MTKRSRNIEQEIYNHFEVHTRAFTLRCRELNMMRAMNAMKKMARSPPYREKNDSYIDSHLMMQVQFQHFNNHPEWFDTANLDH